MGELAALGDVTVEPGRDVMKGGRVVDMDLATVYRGERCVRLVDAGETSAEAVAAALLAEGANVLTLQSGTPDNLSTVLNALEG